MKKISVGTIVESKINSQEGVQVNLSDTGIDTLVLLHSPSIEEINVFKVKHMSFQMKLAVKKDVIFFLFKFGEMPWMDAPFSVHLCSGLTQFPVIEPEHGLSMRVFLIDTVTGKIEAIRVIGLTNNISILLLKLIKEQQNSSFDMDEHITNIQAVYTQKTTEQLVKEGLGTCKLL